MAAGLGFKDFVTGEVLTAADVDGYLMQGVWVFASAAARDAAVTSPQEGNFAYLKDTNVTTYYTGSAWANLDTTGMTNPMTTTGDTIYSSSGSTPARLGIGSTGQVLTVAAGIPSWATASAGGITLISTISLASVTQFTSIPTTYKSLYVVVRGFRPTTNNRKLQMQLNADTGTSYTYWASSAAQFNASGFGFDRYQITDNASSASASDNSITLIELADTAGTTGWQWIRSQAIYADGASAIATNSSYYGAFIKSAAITQIDLFTTSAITGGTALLYGVS